MNIYINGFSSNVGGGITYLENLITYIPKKKINVTLFCSPSFKKKDSYNIKVINSNLLAKSILLRTLWEIFLLPFYLYKHNVDILFTLGAFQLTPTLRKTKKIMMFRNALPFSSELKKTSLLRVKIKNFLLKYLILKSIKNSESVIFVSNYGYKLIDKCIKIKKIIITHGVNSKFIIYDKKIKKPSYLPERYILYVSRFEFYKGHLPLIQAYSKLPDNVRNKFPLVLIGETNSEVFKIVQEKVKFLNLENNIFFYGKVSNSDLPAFYKYSHLIYFGSSCENCPNILLESIGSGRPILCSNIEANREICRDSVTYFDHNNEKSLYTIFLKMLLDKRKRRVLHYKRIKIINLYCLKKSMISTWNLLLHS